MAGGDRMQGTPATAPAAPAMAARRPIVVPKHRSWGAGENPGDGAGALRPLGFWDRSGWKLTVADGRGLTLFSLVLVGIDAPAAQAAE